MKNIKKVALFSFMILFAFLICLPLSKVSAGPVGGFLANPNWVSFGKTDYNSTGAPGVFGAMFAIGTKPADQAWVTSENTQVSILDGSQDLYLTLIDYTNGGATVFSVTQFVSLSEQDLRTYLDGFIAAMGSTIGADGYNLYYSSVPAWVSNGINEDYEWNSGALPAGATVNGATILKTNFAINYFTVNSLGDESDANVGDGVCDIGDGSCTLRAAIQEANSISQDQGVNIDFSVTGKIILTSQLPSIQHDYISILGPGGDNIIVNFNNLDNGFGIDNSSYVTISGLTIEGALHSGIYFSAASSNEIGNNISSNNIILNGTGINLRGINGYSTGVVISNNIINNNQYRGIDLYQASGNNLTLNTISGSNQGIYFDNSSSNEIGHNTISDNSEYGIDFRNLSIENIITSNTISGNSRDGIYLNNSNENIINSNNTISDNLRNGIYLDQSDDNTIEENTISSNISCGISLSNIKGSQIKTNIISSNLQNGICLNDASNNTISSNNISGHGAVAEGYWLAGVSTMKYGDVVYDAIGMNFGGGAITIPTILYAADFKNNISLVSANSNTITNFIEAAGAAAGGFDFGLIHVGDISVPLTAALPHGMIPNLATLELALGEGATAEALLQNVLTKSGDVWTYNGIVNGVNGVVVETDGEAVTLAEGAENPSLTHSAYGPYSGIGLAGTSSSNTFTNNTIENNANGISFTGSADSNLVEEGSIDSYVYNAITDTTDKTNTIDTTDFSASFDRTKVQRTSGTLIILPADEVIPVVPPAPAIPHHTTSGSYIAGHNPFVSTPTSSVPPTDCLPGYLYSPSTGKACGTTSAPTTPKFTFTKNLKYLQIDNEVKELQKFLNTHGYQVSTTGAGSLGNETTKFGSLTQKALIKFQLANKISPAVGYFGPITRALVNSLNN